MRTALTMAWDLNRLAIVSALLVLAALSWWLPYALIERTTIFDGAARHDPDYFLENFTATTMDVTGRAKHTLSAPRLVHYPDDDTTYLVRPHLIQYRPGEAPVHTTADAGWVASSGKEILMTGHVRVVRGGGGTDPGGEVTTNEMRIILE